MAMATAHLQFNTNFYGGGEITHTKRQANMKRKTLSEALK